MIESKILQFLALAAFVLSSIEANYPYGEQQHKNNQHGNYNNQNPNYNSYNNINHNSINDNKNDYGNHNNNNNNINDIRSAHTSNPLFAIYLPKVYLGDFEYLPTRDGYRFSYQLIDGTRRTEVGYIPNAGPVFMPDERTTAERTALRMRAKGNSKIRKLSPKSLQSLAG